MKIIINKINNRILHKTICSLVFVLLTNFIFLHANNFENNWTSLYQGIDYRTVLQKDGKIKIHQIKIDASNPEVEIFTTAPSGDGKHTIATKPSTFLKREKAQIVISGTGSGTHHYWDPEGTPKLVDALAIYNGKQYAKPKHENAAFIVLTDGTKKIIKREDLPKYENRISMAVGAWPSWTGVDGLLIYDGKNCIPGDFADDSKGARAALGISQDKKYIYLVLVEGRSNQESIFKELVSKGISLSNLTAVMQDLGCYSAINLIGEGFATLVVENIINHRSIVLNTLSDLTGERALGHHIGIKAPLISNKEQFRTFRALQEESAFFDLLRKSESALNSRYMDETILKKLDNKVTPLSELYKRFGVSQYTNPKINYDRLFKSKDQSFDNCFIGGKKYDFSCGDPKQYLKKLGINVNEHIIKLSDLNFVGKKEEGWTKGKGAGVYLDSKKVVYFVKNAQSVKNEIIATRLMSLILDKEAFPAVKLIAENPKLVASRMIRGFIMARDLPAGKKVVGKASLALALDFIGLIDRHLQNMGYCELDFQTVKAARVDYDYSFAYEIDPGAHKPTPNNDPLCLLHLNKTLEKYPLNEVLPMLEKIAAIPDEQIVMEVFIGWAILSQIGDPFTLEDSYKLASQLIKRKAAFKKVLLDLKKSASAKKTKIPGEGKKRHKK